MYKRNFFDVYIQEKYNLDSEWYMLQQDLIYNENMSLINSTPIALLKGVINYAYGARSYFEKMYNIIKVEWNHFYIYYKKNSKILKRNRDNITKLKNEANIYGIKYNINSSSVVRYEKLSPTDGFITINSHTLRRLNPTVIKSYSTTLSKNSFDSIRGTMLNSIAITSEEFKSSIYRFYCTDGSTDKILLDDDYINSMYKCDINELLRVKREIDTFYNGVLSFIDEIEFITSVEGEKRLASITKNIKKSNKIIQKYNQVKTIEFKEFAHIYNIYFMSLLSVYRDKIQQDINIIEGR